MKPILEIQHISKKFQIQHETQRYLSLRDSLMSAFKSKTTSEEFYALRDVTFNVQQGESIGIMGKNGAGKSTLLKILSKITPPTSGKIICRGRIASLLEVGTGFHQELSGRENVFLNGSILGMKRKEIQDKFDEIVDFSGVEKFLDTPLKHYSSGMQLRLAFAVAAFLEPEVLVIDEVLAVGDAEFQKKCMGKMKDVASEGKTVLFVSHNMQAMLTICKQGVLLKNGSIDTIGDIGTCVKKYNGLFTGSTVGLTAMRDRANRVHGNNLVMFNDVKAFSKDKETWDFKFDEKITFKFNCIALENASGLLFYMAVLNPDTNDLIGNFKVPITERAITKGETISFSIEIPEKVLKPGQFPLYFALGSPDASKWYDVLDNNVNLPALNIMSIRIDAHENAGLFSLPYKLELNS